MPKRTSDYHSRLLNQLIDPEEAAHYLNASIEDSPEMFLKALRNVAEARGMSKVAEEAGRARESLYRTLSEAGNPRFDTLFSVLSVLGLHIAVQADESIPSSGGIQRLEDHIDPVVKDDRPHKLSGLERLLASLSVFPRAFAYEASGGIGIAQPPPKEGPLSKFTEAIKRVEQPPAELPFSLGIPLGQEHDSSKMLSVFKADFFSTNLFASGLLNSLLSGQIVVAKSGRKRFPSRASQKRSHGRFSPNPVEAHP